MTTDNPYRYTTKPLAEGKPERDYSDSPLKNQRDAAFDEYARQAMEEKDFADGREYALKEREADRQRKLLDYLASDFNILNKGLADALKQLPPSEARQNALHYYSTMLLWAEHAFNEAKAKLESEQ